MGWGITMEVSGMTTRSEATTAACPLDRKVSPILIGCEESQTICQAFRDAGSGSV